VAEPSGRQQSTMFKSKREAAAFLAQMNTAKGTGPTSHRTPGALCSVTTRASGW